MQAQLVWSRTVNVHGKPGKNIASDLHTNIQTKFVKRPLDTQVLTFVMTLVGELEMALAR